MWYGLVSELFAAQKSLCFHCGKPMVLIRPREQPKENCWSREHIYPRRMNRRGLDNAYVLAHQSCNTIRADREPTSDEIARTVALYASIGRKAFTPHQKPAPADYHAHNRLVEKPTLADIWPKSALPESG